MLCYRLHGIVVVTALSHINLYHTIVGGQQHLVMISYHQFVYATHAPWELVVVEPLPLLIIDFHLSFGGSKDNPSFQRNKMFIILLHSHFCPKQPHITVAEHPLSSLIVEHNLSQCIIFKVVLLTTITADAFTFSNQSVVDTVVGVIVIAHHPGISII